MRDDPRQSPNRNADGPREDRESAEHQSVRTLFRGTRVFLPNPRLCSFDEVLGKRGLGKPRESDGVDAPRIQFAPASVATLDMLIHLTQLFRT